MRRNGPDEGERAEWQRLVGTAVLGFGDIEYVALQMLAHIPRDKIVEASAKLTFSRRVDLLIEILSARGNSAAGGEIIEKLKRAKALAEVRNIIAHNPLLLGVFFNQSAGDVLTERAITSARSLERSLDLAGLKEFVREVEDMSGELSLLFGKLIEEGTPAAHK